MAPSRLQRRYYFLAPSDNIEPETSIRLGQIITDPRRPDVKIAEPHYIYESQLNAPDVVRPWRWRHRRGNTADLSLSASALSLILGAGPELGFGHSSNEVLEFAAASLETISFHPDKEYITASMNDAAVLNYLDQHRGASLYMVTGVKIARSPSVRRIHQQDWGGQLGASADGTAAGAPLSGAALMGLGRVRETEEEHGRPGDIVLAVKINKIVTYWGRATGKTKEFLRGTVLDTGSNAQLESGPWGEDDDADEALLGFELLDEVASGEDAGESRDMISKHRRGDSTGEGDCILLSPRRA